jgi:peptidoglycan/xylan/chitin deacetylase (PgdA/CDA1 family)
VLKASILPDDHRLRGASLGSAGICYGNGRQEKEREEMRVVSLLYHDVVTSGDFESSGFPGGDAAIYKLDLSEFERHLNAIQPVISRPVTVHELPHLHGRSTLLTFDDGGSSAHAYIADLLESLGWRAHFFVTTDWIGQRGFLSSAQIRELRSRGHLIGSHSCSHPSRMSYCNRNELFQEWNDSVGVLSDILSEQINLASVPGGYYGRHVAECAAEAGIRTLFTSEPRISSQVVNGCIVLGRFTIRQRVPPATVAAIAAGKIAPRFSQFAYWNLKKIAKTAGGTSWLRMRKWLLAKDS